MRCIWVSSSSRGRHTWKTGCEASNVCMSLFCRIHPGAREDDKSVSSGDDRRTAFRPVYRAVRVEEERQLNYKRRGATLNQVNSSHSHRNRQTLNMVIELVDVCRVTSTRIVALLLYGTHILRLPLHLIETLLQQLCNNVYMWFSEHCVMISRNDMHLYRHTSILTPAQRRALARLAKSFVRSQ